jgi:Tfp pilus assembly protein FimT
MMEMLVVMVVMGVLFAIAMRMLRSDRIAVQQAATIMTGQFARARLEAIKNNENVGIWVSSTRPRAKITALALWPIGPICWATRCFSSTSCKGLRAG